MAALSFRASLEATDHPRSAPLSEEILKWLEAVGVVSELSSLEREILSTPYRRLEAQQLGDARWSGEGAWVLSWALGRVPLPASHEPVDYQPLVEELRVMRPEARELVTDARLRSDAELVAYAVRAWAFRSELHLRRLAGNARTVLAKIERQRLSDLGLTPSEQIISETARLVDDLSVEERRIAAGPAFIREHAMFWILGDRAAYFED
ncbi:MAG: DUF4272 domain-containing protein [Pirellulaceae bacterium]|jgi:hypothetical protein|nr:DUF4272 domain-containing protein [Pirellulaceae bacterium]